MKLSFLVPCLVFGFGLSHCKSVDQAATSRLQESSGDSVPSLNAMSSEDEFSQLALPNKISYPFVKYSHFYGVDSGDPLYDKVFYQNTKTYEFHVNFLKANFPRYKEIQNYEDLILPPRGDESGPSIKEITAGALYYRPASGSEPEVLAFEIYFRNEVTSSGTVKTKIDVAEVARMDKVLKRSISFVPATAIKYVIPEKSDFFTYKSKLDAAGVGHVKSWEFHKAPAGATTYVAAKSYGYLRSISPSDFDQGLYTDKDILIFANVPLDVGPVAGVIVEKPAAAHSHVMFRAQNLNVPGIYIPNAASVAGIKDKLNQLVAFTAREDGSYLIETEAAKPQIKAEAEAYWKSRRKPLETPVADLSVTTIKTWNRDGVSKDDIKAYGAKATNFGILDNALQGSGIDRSRYQNGFMVPFSFFDKHMNNPLSAKLCEKTEKKCLKEFGAACPEATKTCMAQAGGTIRSFVDGMLAESNRERMNSEPAHRRQYLAFMQRLIREAPLAKETEEAIRVAMTAYPPTTRMRLRSSTNAEDIQGLNGAGLYESKSACLGEASKAEDDDGKTSPCRTAYEATRMKTHADKLRTYPDPDGKLKDLADEMIADITKKYPLDDAILKVYASLWTERAFLTREFYSLKHQGIYMGMLSHPSFVDEAANGVAIVEFVDNKPSVVKVETQYDDISVTNPIFPETIPELWTARYKGLGLENITMVTPSTLSASGKTVLSQDELKELAKQLAIAAKSIRDVRGGNRYDLEFILDKDRTILIKQGRPL